MPERVVKTSPKKQGTSWKEQNSLLGYLPAWRKGKIKPSLDSVDPLKSDEQRSSLSEKMPSGEQKGKEFYTYLHFDALRQKVRKKLEELEASMHIPKEMKEKNVMSNQEQGMKQVPESEDTPILIKKVGDFFEKIGWPRPSDTACCYGFFIVLILLLGGILFYGTLDQQPSKHVLTPSSGISSSRAGEKSITFVFPNNHSRHFRIVESGMPWQEWKRTFAAHMFSLPLEPRLMTTRSVFASRDGETFFADVDVLFHFMPMDAVEFVRKHRLTAKFNIEAWLDGKLMESLIVLRPNLTAQELRHDVYGVARTLRDILQLTCEGEGVRIDGIRFRNVYRY